MSRLVLTRKPGQSIEIGPDVVVRVGEIKEGQVRLVVEAPADVKIVREEIAQEVGTWQQPGESGGRPSPVS